MLYNRDSGVARNFKRGDHKFYIFFERIFSGRTDLKLVENQETFQGGPGAYSPGKFLKIYLL